MAVDGSYRFRRMLTLQAGGADLEVAYRLEDLIGHDRPYIWSAHPLFAVEPAMGIELPSDSAIRVWRTADGPPSKATSR